MKRTIAAVVLVILAVFCSGCFGARETDEISYILVVGLDKSQYPGKLDITFQTAVPRALSGEGAGKTEDATITNTVTAISMGEARSLLNSMGARTPTWAHTKVFIIGDELARQGLKDVLLPIMRYREFRGSMYIAVVNDDTARNFIEKNKPKNDIIPSRYYETMFLTAAETSNYLKTDLHDFYNRLKGNSACPLAALVGINNGEDHPNRKRAVPPGLTDQYEAGSLPRHDIGNGKPKGAGDAQDDKGSRTPDDPTEFIGTALFRGDRMVGKLTGQETRALSILNGQFRRGFITVQDPLMPRKPVVINLRLGQKPKLKADIVEGKAVLTAEVFLEGEITNIPSGINYEIDDYRTLLEEQVSQALRVGILSMLRKTQELGTDVVGFGYVARSNFQTYDELLQTDWCSMYGQADIEVNVKSKMRRTGLMWKTSPTGQEGN